MAEPKKPRETIALAKNKMYKTYQFHGIVGRGKDPDFIFRAAIATVFTWLKERFRQFDDIPSQLNLPDNPKAITDDMLASFSTTDGYSIETLYIKEEGIWAFRLTEPDMGSSERDPAPGRLFLTNFGFKKGDTEVEFGCQLVCAQPESIPEDAEVFRPKLVRDLMEKFGLYEFCELKYKAFDLSKPAHVKLLTELLAEDRRQMPVVVLAKHFTKEPDIAALAASIEGYRQQQSSFEHLMPHEHLGPLKLPLGAEIPAARMLKTEAESKFIEEADKLAGRLAGFAYVFRNTEADKDGCQIHYPGKPAIEERFSKLAENVTAYPKRNEQFGFGQVRFFTEAKLLKQNLDLGKLKRSEDYIAENTALKEKLELLKKQIGEKKQIMGDLAGDNQTKQIRNQELRHQLQIEKSKWDRERAELERTIQGMEFETRDMARRLERVERRASRPEDAAAFIKWVEANYDEDIILLPRARDGLKKANRYDADDFCDAIEVLAEVYKQHRLGNIGDEEYIAGCMSRGGTAFEIGACGDQNITRFAEKYKVFYNTDSRDNKDRRALDLHLKSGVDSRYMVRIYFFWDPNAAKVVIGSMPDHLPTMTVS